MTFRAIYTSRDGRVILGKRGNVYCVDIAGIEYGPFSWRYALDFYRRHKG